MHANFNGGSYDVRGIDITTEGFYFDTFPMNFTDTVFKGSERFSAAAIHDTLTMTGTSIESPTILLQGGVRHF